MADAIALEILATGDPEAWKRFVRSSDREIDLSRAKISNESLNYFDFTGCLLDEVVFDDCLLASTKFESIFLRQARFRKCDLSGASFRNTDLSGTVFDRCEVYNSDFEESVGLETANIQTSFGDDSTITPEEIIRPSDWYNFLDDDEDNDSSVDKNLIPSIPSRVFAPVETDWQNGRLVLRHYDNVSFLSDIAKAGVISGLKFSLNDLYQILQGTNFDQRIVDLIRSVDCDFPDNPKDFGSRIFSLWFRLRPVFEYARATKGQHSDYLEAQVFSFELNFRDALNSYPEWREYQAAAQAIVVTQNFDEAAFIKHQISFAKNLLLVEDYIDKDISEKLVDVTKIQKIASTTGTFKSVIYGAAASVANIISRIIQRVLGEISDGSYEGIKDATKKIVSNTILGSGAVLLWFLTTGLGSFPWLKNAWDFVRQTLGVG